MGDNKKVISLTQEDIGFCNRIYSGYYANMAIFIRKY